MSQQISIKHAKRGLAYQCMKCLPKTVIWELSRMKSHHYKEHWSADNFPLFCSLCTYRCHTVNELISHETSFGPHIDARRAAILKNEFKGDPAYRKNGNRVRAFNQEMHDLDFVALSREQSASYWATRARTAPPAIRPSVPVMAPVQSPLLSQVSNPQQMAYVRPVDPIFNRQLFNDRAVWSVPSQQQARQQRTATVTAPSQWQPQVSLSELGFTEVPTMPSLLSQQPLSAITPEPSNVSSALEAPLSYLESFLPIAVNSSPAVSVAIQQPLTSTSITPTTLSQEESVNVLDQILFDGEEMFMESSPPPCSVTSETHEDSCKKVAKSAVELSNHATVLETLQTVTSTNTLLTEEVSALSQEVKQNSIKNTTLSSDVSYLRGQIRQQERLLTRQQGMLRSVLNILQTQQRQKPMTFRNSARTRFRPYNLQKKKESSPKPAVRSVVNKKDGL